MKEIKFIGYHKTYNILFKVQEIDPDDSGYCPKRIHDGESLFFIDRKDCELLQFTTQHDMDNNDIYEGFILRDTEENILYKVLFKNGMFIMQEITSKQYLPLTRRNVSKCKIIGNIYNCEFSKYGARYIKIVKKCFTSEKVKLC